MVYQRLKDMQRWLFPSRCLLCQARVAADSAFCTPCRQSLPWLNAACAHCGTALPAARPACGACLKRPPRFDRTRALFHYAAPIDRLVLGFKYGARLDFGRVLGSALATAIAADPMRVEAIVPVPLHRRRLRERGYNQSLELARPIARALGIPLLTHAVRRVRPTPPQTRLDYAQRRRNLRQAFVVSGDVAGKRLAIVDDVMTSGHTANALARCLKQAGAKEVVVWVVARA